MPTKFGKFSTSGNKAYIAKPTRQPKAPAPKANAGRVRDVNPGLPTVGRLGGFKRLGGSRSKTYYGG